MNQQEKNAIIERLEKKMDEIRKKINSKVNDPEITDILVEYNEEFTKLKNVLNYVNTPY